MTAPREAEGGRRGEESWKDAWQAEASRSGRRSSPASGHWGPSLRSPGWGGSGRKPALQSVGRSGGLGLGTSRPYRRQCQPLGPVPRLGSQQESEHPAPITQGCPQGQLGAVWSALRSWFLLEPTALALARREEALEQASLAPLLPGHDSDKDVGSKSTERTSRAEHPEWEGEAQGPAQGQAEAPAGRGGAGTLSYYRPAAQTCPVPLHRAGPTLPPTPAAPRGSMLSSRAGISGAAGAAMGQQGPRRQWAQTAQRLPTLPREGPGWRSPAGVTTGGLLGQYRPGAALPVRRASPRGRFPGTALPGPSGLCWVSRRLRPGAPARGA